MFSSTIIPTVNRPTLSRAVFSVLDQAFTADDFQVIVVNDSGQPLPEMAWQQSPRVRVIDTNRRERSVARNTGAAIARGEYLNFLDDDDWLLPGALDIFWTLCRRSEAQWYYGAYQVVDNTGTVIAEYHPPLRGNIFANLIAGEGIPMGASLLQADLFFRVGAFDPGITGVEDRDLGRRMALHGRVKETTELVAAFRAGQESSTTKWEAQPEKDRRAREKALREEGAFSRLRASAKSNHLRGRVTRAYLGSTILNLRSGNFLTAASRASAALLFASPYIFSADFWRGVRYGVNEWMPKNVYKK